VSREARQWLIGAYGEELRRQDQEKVARGVRRTPHLKIGQWRLLYKTPEEIYTFEFVGMDKGGWVEMRKQKLTSYQQKRFEKGTCPVSPKCAVAIELFPTSAKTPSN